MRPANGVRRRPRPVRLWNPAEYGLVLAAALAARPDTEPRAALAWARDVGRFWGAGAVGALLAAAMDATDDDLRAATGAVALYQMSGGQVIGGGPDWLADALDRFLRRVPPPPPNPWLALERARRAAIRRRHAVARAILSTITVMRDDMDDDIRAAVEAAATEGAQPLPRRARAEAARRLRHRVRGVLGRLDRGLTVAELLEAL